MSEEEFETLQVVFPQANKSMRELERKYSKLAQAASEVLRWAEFDGARYTVGTLPIDELRKALKSLQAESDR